MSEAMFSGWGIRTAGENQALYNPLGYHVGSVWPHDNAMILEGMRRYGLVENVGRLATAMVEAVLGSQDGRVPELFSGDRRVATRHPTPYPVSSRPQAWSAASLPWMLMTMLGIGATDPETLHIVRPVLPPWLEWARVRDLRFGASVVDVRFWRSPRGVGIEVERQEGPGRVVVAPRWPLEPLTA